MADALVAAGVIKDESDVSVRIVKTRVVVVPHVLPPIQARTCDEISVG